MDRLPRPVDSANEAGTLSCVLQTFYCEVPESHAPKAEARWMSRHSSFQA